MATVSKEFIKGILKDIENPYLDTHSLEFAFGDLDLLEYDDPDYKKLDILLVQVFEKIEKRFLSPFDQFNEETWRWHAHEVATGKYPLEKLPDHVRDLAKTLYYN